MAWSMKKSILIGGNGTVIIRGCGCTCTTKVYLQSSDAPTTPEPSIALFYTTYSGSCVEVPHYIDLVRSKDYNPKLINLAMPLNPFFRAHPSAVRPLKSGLEIPLE